MDLRREKAGLAATEAMWRLKYDQEEMRLRRECATSVMFRILEIIYIIILSLMSGSKIEH